MNDLCNDDHRKNPDKTNKNILLQNEQVKANKHSQFDLPGVQDLFDEKFMFGLYEYKNSYDSIEEFFCTQFYSYQDDLLKPVRNTIREYLNKTEINKESDICIYKNIQLTGYKISYNKFGIKAQLNLPLVDQSSQQFMSGRLLILTKDNFDTILLASITSCNKNDLAKGYILIEPIKGTVITIDMFKFNYILLKTKINIELDMNVLDALKSLSMETFPLQNYLIQVQTYYELPSYLLHKRYTRTEILKNSEDIFLRSKSLELNEIQSKALQKSLTQEFSVIQGLPCTGKTFLISEIVKHLLETEGKWGKYSPILILCSRNDTLDQILQRIFCNYTESVVHLGNQTNSANLKSHLLTEKLKHFSDEENSMHLFNEKKKETEKILEYIEKYNLCIKYLTTPNIIVPINCLFDSLPLKKFQTNEKLIFWVTGIDINNLSKYLVSQKILSKESEKHCSYQEDIDTSLSLDLTEMMTDVFEPIFSLEYFEKCIKFLKEKIQNLRTSNSQLPTEQLCVLEEELELMIQEKLLLQHEFCHHPLLNQPDLEITDYTENNLKEVQKQDLVSYSTSSITKLRWEKYWKWLKLSHEYLINEVLKLEEKYRINQEHLQTLQKAIYVGIMKKQLVIGLTDICAVKFQSYLRDLQAPIVLVDEAEKISDAHILCSFSKECKHMILIGDYEQLGSKEPNSMFQRYVSISSDVITLTHQYGVQPQLSKLLFPLCSEKIHTGNCLSNHFYPDVLGMGKNLYFIDHDHAEKRLNDDDWINEYEAEFLIELARYLLLQGYEPTEITILCAYDGQLATINEKITQDELLNQIYVSTISSHRQKANTIVLLSLVRNNGQGNIGLLEEINIIFVALSQAHEGLYIMGNMTDLTVGNSMWVSISEILKEENAIGCSLTLKCRIHLDQYFEAEAVEDFQKFAKNGCAETCNEQLPCGHNFAYPCHLTDRQHKEIQCMQECTKKCPNGHSCLLKCKHECEPCSVTIQSKLKCGHTVEHMCSNTVDKCKNYCKTRLPCGHACSRKCHFDSSPNHLKYLCPKDCTKKNIGCVQNHPCKKRCYEVCEACDELVDKKCSSCGHITKNIKCSSTFLCTKSVLKRSPCGHDVLVRCCEQATRDKCDKNCSKLLVCGHPCTEKCMDPCTEMCDYLVKIIKPGPCNHFFSVPCHMQSFDIDDLSVYCKEPCTTVLKCGHICKGNCNDCYQGCMHVLCSEPCNTIFVCGHKCDIPCNSMCQPCSRPCELECQHSKCDKKCGEPCIPCQEPCSLRCEHQHCTKRCYEPCDIKPCNEPCKNILKCNHPCIGFCGDPCPQLCRVCDNDKLTEIFFGNEDDLDSRYVLLPDCGHCIENKGLLKWINDSSEQNEIQVKTCPKCKTPINKCMRVMSYMKKDIMDIISIKRTTFFNGYDEIFSKRLQKRHTTKYSRLIKKFKVILSKQKNEKLDNFFQYSNTMENFLLNQTLSSNEIDVLRIFSEILDKTFETCKLALCQIFTRHKNRLLADQIVILITSVPTELRISAQRVEDLQLELQRLYLMVQIFHIEPEKDYYDLSSVIVKKDCLHIVKKLIGYERFTEDLEKDILEVLEISNTLLERETIVKAMGFKKGHWFKCPNGHFYVIGECGGAVEHGKCIECKTTVGGERYRLEQDNVFTPELDEATGPAWRGAMY